MGHIAQFRVLNPLAGTEIKDTCITFNLAYFQLESINLSDNFIELLDKWSRSPIDTLHYNTTHHNAQPIHPSHSYQSI